MKCCFEKVMKSLLLIFIMSLPLLLSAQIIKYPTYSKRDDTSIDITEIEKTTDFTIVRGVYKNPHGNQAWANINQATYLRDKKTGTKYNIIKSEGLPISPYKKTFSYNGETTSFSFYFPRINDNIDIIDFIENPDAKDFNFYGIALNDNVDRKFTISHIKGNSFSYKPSLASRLNGVKEVQVFVPKATTDVDKYIYGNFISYLGDLGISTDVIYVSFENKPVELTTMAGFFRVCTEDVWKYAKNANTLAAVLHYNYIVSGYSTDINVVVNFFDFANGYDWSLPKIEVPNKGEKLKNRFRNNITKYYSFDSSCSFIPSSIVSNWSERIFRDEIEKNGADPLEGIYKGNELTVGVKKADDGKYYVIYLDGAVNPDDWCEGDIKAVLKNTASPILYKADWYGRWKHKSELTITFSSVGFILEGEDIDSESFIKMFPDANMVSQFAAKNTKSSGTGFFITKDGYIVTNNHVIENAKSIKITGVNNDYQTSYTAKVEITDPQNDLAILRIKDSSFTGISSIPYTFKFNTSSVGEDCFVLGYPLISTMGTDIKLTTGVISSKTGYEGSISDYQISAPVQPGNSGAPLFDKNGNIIGVIKAKHTQAENAGYAVKASYVRNLIELLPTTIDFPNGNVLINKPLPKQVELASKSVCLIIVNGE